MRNKPVSNLAPLPASFEAQLALLVRAAPEGEEWFHEIKYDGYRIGCRVDGSDIRLLSRNNKDWTERFSSVRDAIEELGAARAFLDGEVCVVLPDGRTSFQGLQNIFTGEGTLYPLTYFVFDLLHLNGEDLRRKPLAERKERLRAFLGASTGTISFSEHAIGGGAKAFARACDAGAEGIISKQRDLAYQSGRGRGWLKVKCSARQELVIGGFTEPKGSRVGIGALLVGLYDEAGALLYAGKVGTGFTQASATDLRRRLENLETKECPFQTRPRRDVGEVHWARPALVAEVEFTEWTADGKIRHPSFKGLRADKDPREVNRERAPSQRRRPSRDG